MFTFAEVHFWLITLLIVDNLEPLYISTTKAVYKQNICWESEFQGWAYNLTLCC